jgi:hypothetical protein
VIGITPAAGNLGAVAVPLAGADVAARSDWRLRIAFLLPLLAVAPVGVWTTTPRHEGTSGPVGELSTRRLQTFSFGYRRSLARPTAVHSCKAGEFHPPGPRDIFWRPT